MLLIFTAVSSGVENAGDVLIGNMSFRWRFGEVEQEPAPSRWAHSRTVTFSLMENEKKPVIEWSEKVLCSAVGQSKFKIYMVDRSADGSVVVLFNNGERVKATRVEFPLPHIVTTSLYRFDVGPAVLGAQLRKDDSPLGEALLIKTLGRNGKPMTVPVHYTGTAWIFDQTVFGDGPNILAQMATDAVTVISKPQEQSKAQLQEALETLGQVGGLAPDREAAADAVARFLESDDPILRRDAVRAIGTIASETRVLTALPVLYDSDRDVRLAAIQALGQAGGRSLLIPLRLWHHQIAESDGRRAPEDKWLDDEMEQRYKDVLRQINQRLDEKK